MTKPIKGASPKYGAINNCIIKFDLKFIHFCCLKSGILSQARNGSGGENMKQAIRIDLCHRAIGRLLLVDQQ